MKKDKSFSNTANTPDKTAIKDFKNKEANSVKKTEKDTRNERTKEGNTKPDKNKIN